MSVLESHDSYFFVAVGMADALQSTVAEDPGDGTNVNKSKKEIKENERLKMQ